MSTRASSRYTTLKRLGKGGTGEVFLAVCKSTGKPVALKTLRPARNSGLKREFITLAGLRHPNLCRVWDFGYFPGQRRTPFLVREYVPGKSLMELVGRLSFDRIRSVVLQLLRALCYLHNREVAHGDIKPANVLLSPDFQAKLIDFHLGFKDPSRRGFGGGTFPYLPPERLNGKRTRPSLQDDLFSLGVTIFHSVTGALPAAISHPAALASWYEKHGQLSLSSAAANAPQELDGLVAALTRYDPRNRITTAEHALQFIGESPQARSVSPSWVHFAGRSNQLNLITKVLAGKAKSGRPQLALVSGARGSGKTRLLEEAAPPLKARGFRVFGVWKRGQVLNSLLSEAVEGRVSGPAPGDPVASLIERIGMRPACLIIDGPPPGNLQPILRRLLAASRLRLMILVSLRQAEPAPDLPYTPIRLGGLSRTRLAGLTADYFRCEAVDPGLADEIWKLSRGLPGPLLSLLKSAKKEQAPVVNEAGVLLKSGPLPAGPDRTAPVPVRLKRLARFLTLAGEPVPKEVLIRALGHNSQSLVEEALAAGLITELETGASAGLALNWEYSKPASPGSRAPVMHLRLAAAYLKAGNALSAAFHLLEAGALRRCFQTAWNAFRSLRDTYTKDALCSLALALKACRHLSEREVWALRLRALKLACELGDEELLSRTERQLPPSRLPLPAEVVLLSLKAGRLERKGMYAEAGKKFSEAAGLIPLNSPLHTAKLELLAMEGNCAFHTGDQARARELFLAVSKYKASNPGSAGFPPWYRAQTTAATGLGLLGEPTYAQGVVQRILSLQGLPSRLRLRPLGELAIRAAEKGEIRKAHRIFKQVQESARELGDSKTQVSALLNRAVLQYKLRKLKRAESLFQQAFKACIRWGQLSLRPAVWCGLATVKRLQGDLSRAHKLFNEALQMKELRAGFRVNTLVNLGEVYQLLGAGRKALQTREKAAELAERLGDHYLRALAFFGLFASQAVTGLAREGGRSGNVEACGPNGEQDRHPLPGAAASAGSKAEKLAQERGEQRFLAGNCLFQAIEEEGTGDWRRSIHLFGKALAHSIRAKDIDYRAGALLGIVRAFLQGGATNRAAEALERVQPSKGGLIAWEYRCEKEVWRWFLEAKKGSKTQGVLRLSAESSRLSLCPELKSLCLLLCAGIIKEELGVNGAWIPYRLNAEYLLERLTRLGSPGSSKRVETILRSLFPKLLSPEALPWTPLTDFPGPGAYEVYAAVEGKLILLGRYGAPVPRGRDTARRALLYTSRQTGGAQAETQFEDQRNADAKAKVFPEENAVLVFKAKRAPRNVRVRAMARFHGLTCDLRDQLLLRLKEENKGTLSKVRIETAAIRSRETAARANRLIEKSAQEEEKFVAASKAYRSLVRELPDIARSDLPVLLLGESGTGKDLLAKTIHRMGKKEAPLVAQDCGALPESLLEAELFGVKKGAFTGAEEDRRGLLHAASRGTLYLDGVEALSRQMQAKLLRFLEDGFVRPLGGHRSIYVPCRIIASSRLTFKQLKASLRKDFFYRINPFTVLCPPLREALDNLEPLLEELLRRWTLTTGNPRPSVDKAVTGTLSKRSWRGNVRELENVLKRALARNPSKLSPETLTPGEEAGWEFQALTPDRPLRVVKDRVEADYLRALLRANGGSVGESAKKAGITRRHMLNLLKKHKIAPGEFRHGPAPG